MSVQFLVSSVVTDLTGFFRAVATEPFAMLLDSAAPDHPNSRYDILVCRPSAYLTATGRHCQVHYFDSAQPRQQVHRVAARVHHVPVVERDAGEVGHVEHAGLVHPLHQRLVGLRRQVDQHAAAGFLGGALDDGVEHRLIGAKGLSEVAGQHSAQPGTGRPTNGSGRSRFVQCVHGSGPHHA